MLVTPVGNLATLSDLHDLLATEILGYIYVCIYVHVYTNMHTFVRETEMSWFLFSFSPKFLSRQGNYF